MKKMLKGISIILIIASTVILLTGCGKKKEETPKTTPSENVNVENNVEEQKNNSTEEFSMGEWNNGVYENKFLGLKFKLPDGWTYSSDEEIARTMNIGKELLNDDQKAAAEIANLTSAYYIMANNPNTGDSISIMTEKPLMEATTEYYLSQLKSQLSSVESIKYEVGEVTKEKVANTEFDVLTATGKANGIEFTQKYYVRKMDKYFVDILVTDVSGKDDIKNITTYFE